MENCLFCKILRGEIPSEPVYESRSCYAFKDINPAAPVHILIIPKTHINAIGDIDDSSLSADLFSGISEIVKKYNLEESGYRIVVNSGKDGQQSVPHLHFHILGKRSLQWPPG
ncbi:MAG: histidine triad nucleotide-binding protein [Fibrobacterota bacterium]